MMAPMAASLVVVCSTDCLSPTFSPVSPKFPACYSTGQWGEFTVKNTTLNLHILSWNFLLFFIIFRIQSDDSVMSRFYCVAFIEYMLVGKLC